MKQNSGILLLLFYQLANQVISGQCTLSVETSSYPVTCAGCNDGKVSVQVSGGTAPYIYSWMNDIVPGTTNIIASKDNSIYEQSMSNSNGAGDYFVAGETAAGFKNRALLAFDIAGNIPAGAAIYNAILQLYVYLTSGTTGAKTHLIHKLSQNWGEGNSYAFQPGQGTAATTDDATWLTTFYPGLNWTIAGGTYSATVSASAVVNAPGFYNWSSPSMIADVQSWLNSPSGNFGWLLKSEETGSKQAKRYASKENSTATWWPKLTVSYGPSIVGTANSVSNLPSGTYKVIVTDANGCTAIATSTISTGTNNTPRDVTTYRGAFAPSPTRQWTEDWTNWNPQITAYPATNVSIPAGNLTTQTWTSNNTYLITGIVYVPSGVTLTIEPGTVIRGNGGNSSILVARGGKLIAEGTACRPIVFTSNQPANSRATGDWGGILLLGKARHNLGTNNLIEGLDNTNTNNFHGGTDDDDNSGILKYVRIEFAGFIFSPNNEINGLTFGSVGRGTTIDYVQVTRANDDAFEWFGGSVNCKHLVAYQCIDDDWDTDNGFNGTVQYGLSIKDPNFSDQSQSEGFESDNSAGGVNIGTPSSNQVGAPILQAPKTSAKFYNITQIGGFRCASNANASGVAPTTLFLHRRGARYRRNTDLKIFNSILMNNWRGLFVDNAQGTNSGGLTAPTTVNFNEDSAVFRNNVIAGDFTTTWTTGAAGTYAGTKSLAFEDANSRTIGTLAAYQNDSLNTCSALVDAWNVNPALADFRPNVAGAGAILTDPTNLTSGADLNPFIDILGGLFTANESKEFNVFVLENNAGSSNGAITLTIPGLTGWTITVGNTQANDNANWTFTTAGDGTVTATSKPGQVIEKNGFRQLGFTAVRKGTTPSGTNQNLSANISGGGDVTPGNNSQATIFSAN